MKHPLNNKLAVSLADAERRYKNASAVIMAAYDALTPVARDQVTPHQLDAAVEQFLAAGKKIEATSTQTRPDPDEVSRLGDYGISFLTDLSVWARRLNLNEIEPEFDYVVVAFADWTARHAGQLRTIEPLVDALANLANRTREPQPLEHLTHLMTRLIRATAPLARTGVGQSFPTRPWRLLHLNRGIVATRTKNTALMEEVFDELVSDVPGDAHEFFAEGMQQMDKFDYPAQVRTVMTRYFDRWTRARMH